MSDPLIFLGVDWTDPAVPRLRVVPRSRGMSSFYLPNEQAWGYTAVPEEPRRCTGYFDLAITPASHVPCRDLTAVSRGTQCSRCRAREGFTGAHTSHNEGGPAQSLPDHVRRYLEQPHLLYLDVFPDGTLKVGTAAASRRHSRLSEQGPVLAVFVARGEDGAQIRKAEADVGSHFALATAVTSRRKLAALQRAPVDAGRLRGDLDRLAEGVTAHLRRTPREGLRVFPEVDPWKAPATSMVVFEHAPLMPYPRPLAMGEHHFVITGVAGSIAALAPTPGQPAAWVADLNQLRGHTITLGEYRPERATPSDPQPAAPPQGALW